MSFTVRVRGREFEVRISNSGLKPVHPAVDVVDGKAYLGLWLPVEIYRDGELVDVGSYPFIVSDDGVKILYDRDSLAVYGLKPLFPPIEHDNWWSGRLVDVDPGSYYMEVLGWFKYYVDAPEDALHLFSLWTIGTAFYIIFPSYPYLFLHGPRRSGKSLGRDALIYISMPLGEGNMVSCMPIGDIVDSALKEETVREDGYEVCYKNPKGIKVLQLNPYTLKLEWVEPRAFIRHRFKGKLLRVKTRSGREVYATKDHSFIVFENGVVVKSGGELKVGDVMLTVKRVPEENPIHTYKDADVFLDEVSSIEEVEYDGYVYDLSTDYETFVANDIVVHNTKTLTLIRCMGFNAVRSHSMTEATLYRLIQNGRVTLLLDEQDYLVNPERRAEFRVLLLGGYKKGSFVYRSEKTSKGKIIPQRFEIYSPKALANIEGLEDVLLDRTITVSMMRTADSEIARREPDEDDPVWIAMRDKLASLFLKYHGEVKTCYEDMRAALGDIPDFSRLGDLSRVCEAYWGKIYARNRELWLPILSMALFFERHGVEGLLERMFRYAAESIDEKAVDEMETPEVGLVSALLKIVDRDDWYALSDIAEEARIEMDSSKLDSKTVGRMMKRLGFKKKIKKGGRIFYWLTLNGVRNVARRLQVEAAISQTTPQTLQTPQTPQTPRGRFEELCSKAEFWARGKLGFTSNDIAIALGVSKDIAAQVVRTLCVEGRIIQIGEDLYRAA
ncbi:MAG: Hint domain-containing protein [Desulfurococcaceae archaeon]